MNRAFSLICVLGMAAITFVACFYAERYQTGVVLVAPLLLAGGVVVVAACMGKPWALKVSLFVIVFGISAAIKSTASNETATAYKLALWSVAFVIGLANLPASLQLLRSVPSLGLLAYLALAIASTTYSAVPSYTFGCAVGVLFIVPFAAAVVARLSRRDLLVVLLLSLGSHVALALLLWLVAPDIVTWKNWGGGTRLRGLVGHPGSMADVAGLSILCALLVWRERWLSTRGSIVIAGLGIAALLLSETRSGMLAAIVAMFSVGRYRMAGVAFGGIVLFAALLATFGSPRALNAIAYEVTRGGGDTEDTLTLSGRLHIWEQSLILFKERPLFGYGYASTRVLFLSKFTRAKSEGDTPPHAHNVVVQSLVTTGLIGTIILLIPLLYPVVHALRNRDAAANPFVCFVMIMAMTSAEPVGVTPGLLTLVWMISLYLSQFTMIEEARYRAMKSYDLTGAHPAKPVAMPASLAQTVWKES